MILEGRLLVKHSSKKGRMEAPPVGVIAIYWGGWGEEKSFWPVGGRTLQENFRSLAMTRYSRTPDLPGVIVQLCRETLEKGGTLRKSREVKVQ